MPGHPDIGLTPFDDFDFPGTEEEIEQAPYAGGVAPPRAPARTSQTHFVPQSSTHGYRDGDELNLFRFKSPEYVATVQNQLVNAGVLMPWEFRAGEWDQKTQASMYSVMAFANQTGQPWQSSVTRLAASVPEETRDALEKYRQSKLGGGEPEKRKKPKFFNDTFQSDVYKVPNRKVVKDAVSQALSQALGSGFVTPERIEQYSQAFMADWRSKYEQEESIRKRAFSIEEGSRKAQYDTAYDNEEVADPTKARSAAEADDMTVTDIDPVANMEASIRDRFSKAISGREQLDTERQGGNNLSSIISSITGSLGQGGS